MVSRLSARGRQALMGAARSPACLRNCWPRSHSCQRLASGIDTAAHLGALDANGRTVAVIGTGLMRNLSERKRCPPRTNRQYGNGAFSIPARSSSHEISFPMRNAVMSGFASATVVIEADWKSGARMQARLALEHGRQVFLMEQLRQHDWARDMVNDPALTSCPQLMRSCRS